MRVKCVVCPTQFEQAKADHYPDAVPERERWTCSRMCKKKLESKSLQVQQEQLQLRRVADEPAIEEALSEAEKAREALSQQPDLGAPEDATWLVPGDSDETSLLQLSSGVLDLASKATGVRDRAFLMAVAQDFMNSAAARVEGRLPDDEPN